MNDRTEAEWRIDENDAIESLGERAPALGRIIRQIGPLRRKIYPDPFIGLLRAIIGQQISGKAHDAIWERFQARFCPLTPERIAAVAPEEIRKAGVSLPRARYLARIAAAFASGSLKAESLAAMSDDELMQTLGSLAGVGQWTVEMLLIFTFQRPDILSYRDLGIRRGLSRLYGYGELTPEQFRKHRECYRPHGTLASLYLWEIAAGKGEIKHDMENHK